MSNTNSVQSAPNSKPQRLLTQNEATTLRGVRQDKDRPKSARVASRQSGPVQEVQRAQHMNSKTVRSQNHEDDNQKLVKVSEWVKPRVKAELQRIAAQEGLSVSAIGRALLERALQQHIDMQYHALLLPVIEKSIQKGIEAYSNRLAALLVRVAFASEQTRAIVTNILTRQPGVTPDVLNTILDGSKKTAKRNITHRTPELESIIEELKALFQKGEDEK